MKKVLIISYFFPPANFVGGNRAASWVEGFHKFGLFPIVITRNWNNDQKNVLDKVLGNEYKIEKNDNYEIHRLPYKFSIRDRFALSSSFSFLSKILTFKELIFSNYFISSLPYSNFYKIASKTVSTTPEIDTVIISGGPFPQFLIGDKLAKTFGVKWVADYRDEWTSHQEKQPTSFVNKFIFNLQRKCELRVTKSASFFTTVSPLLKESLEGYIKRPGEVVMNGFDKTIVLEKDQTNASVLNLLYVGTLYLYQDMKTIVESVIEINKRTKFPICLTFVGVEIVKEAQNNLKEMIKEFPQLFKISPRVSKQNLKEYYEKSDILYLSNYEKNIGWLPVKLFEYFSLNKPILLCPSDKDVMEEFINETNSGFIANNEDECNAILEKCINQKKKGIPISLDINYEEGKKYSREYQTEILAKLLNEKFKAVK